MKNKRLSPRVSTIDQAAKKRIVVHFLHSFFIRICSIANLCVPNDSYDGEFFTKQSKTKPKRFEMLLFMALQLFYLCGVGIFSDLDFLVPMP
jgi:hypothetical protein